MNPIFGTKHAMQQFPMSRQVAGGSCRWLGEQVGLRWTTCVTQVEVPGDAGCDC